ncbi:hypothetical protein OS175_10755 [Marinicella sp. S1101]|uniref:hypothetical protein n=1 Tax=Marinicella marina TaxID=2996016 RepID=UPI002260995B|nr:hypothetical protein [Marinicella marina]MCX7554361.1 hypothetical protein [Marinicella marina]MDJ1138648.1 hypothetical protein [Marinicella marina]
MQLIKRFVMVLLLVSMASAVQADFKSMVLKPAQIGPQWEGGTGVVIEDMNNPPAFFAQSMATTINQFKSIGVTSMANLAYRKKTNVMHQVELKFFVFESSAAATAWKKEKYGYEDWQQHYEFSEHDDLAIFDSTQINKRIVFYRNYWLTVASPSDVTDHQLFVEKVIAIIKEKTSSK